MPPKSLLCVAALAYCTLAAPALADDRQPAPTSPAKALPGVRLSVVGQAPNVHALEAHVESWFRGEATPVRVAASTSLDSSAVFAPTAEPGVRIWILLLTPSAARVFFAVQQGASQSSRYLVSDVALDRGLDELGMEQLAQVVYLSATALWAGNVESSREEIAEGLKAAPRPPHETEPPSSHENPARAPRPSAAVGIGVDYTVRARGREGLAQGPGAQVSALWSVKSFEIGGVARAGFLLPDRPSSADVDLELKGATFGLGFALTRALSSHWRATAELGPGLDLVQYRATNLGDGALRASGEHLDVRPLSYGRVGARATFGAFSVGCEALLVVQFLRSHYDIATAGVRTELLASPLVQPGLAVTLAWSGR